MKVIDYEELELDSDEHVFHMWEPLKFEVTDSYEFVISSLLTKGISNIIFVIIYPILWILNKVLFGFTIEGKEKIKQIKGGKVTISNHVHPMDCTMMGLINFPKRTYYPTLAENFKIPFIRHIIRILYAIPIPSKLKQKEKFFYEINNLLKKGKTVQMYPEGSLWPYYEKIRDFKLGAFRMAVEADVPIVPIRYIFTEPKGVYRLYKKKKCIHAVVLDPIYPNNELDLPQRVESLKQRAIEAIQKI